MHVIFVGDPGVGKSTLLNGLVMDLVFHSGLSFGSGFTQRLQTHKAKDGIQYTDTPGLADCKIEKKAAVEITKALKLTNSFKLVFVVTEKGGRLTSFSDTINQVLNAFPLNKEVSFGILVNKMSQTKISHLQCHEHDKLTFVGCLNKSIRLQTEFVYFYKQLDCLDDEDNKLHVPTAGLRDFIHSLPVNYFESNEIGEVCDLDKKNLEEMQQAKLREIERERKEQQARHESEMRRMQEKRQRELKEAREKQEREKRERLEGERRAREKEMQERLERERKERERQYEEERKRIEELIKRRRRSKGICIIS